MKTEHCQRIVDYIVSLSPPPGEEYDEAMLLLNSEIKENEGTVEFRVEKKGPQQSDPDLPKMVEKYIKMLVEERSLRRNSWADPGYEWAEDFLKHYAKCGVISKAALATGVTLSKVNHLKKSNKKFKALMEAAKEEFADAVEYAAITRAIDGVEVKKFYKDQPLIDPETGQQYTERQYSDTLLGKLLEAKRREEFGKKEKHEHSFAGEVRVAGMSPEEARQEVINRIQKLVDN